MMLMQFIWGLGVPEEEVEFNDVYGLDEELLEMVPKPVLAVMFLFPYTAQVIPLINAHLCQLSSSDNIFLLSGFIHPSLSKS